MAEQFPRDNKTESNPFRPSVPSELRDFNPELYEFLREVQETLRAQHNRTQAGDSTFSWEMLTEVELRPRYTLGSTGRFYHPTYGMIQARYCQFTGMRESDWLGAPCGHRVNRAPWSVTNDFTKSRADLVVGLGGFYTLPDEGSYGWVIVNGVNVQELVCNKADTLAQFDKFVWGANDQVNVAESAIGRIFGSVLLGAVFEEIIDEESPLKQWKIPPGYAFVDYQSDSEYRIKQWIEESIAGILAATNSLETRVAFLEGLEVETRFASVETDITNLENQFTLTSKNQQLTWVGYNRRLTDLEALVGAPSSSISVDLTQLRNEYESYVTLTDAQLVTFSNILDSHSISISTLEAFQVFAESQFESIASIAARLGGTVTGPASSTDSGFARFDGITGDLLKDSPATITTTDIDDDAVTIAKFQDITSARVLGRATPGSGNVEQLTTTGTGNVVLSDDPVFGDITVHWANFDSIWTVAAEITTLTVPTAIELGSSGDTTLVRSSAGNVTIEGNLIYRADGVDVPVADGGTGASNAADARTNLGLLSAALKDIGVSGDAVPILNGAATTWAAGTTWTGAGMTIRVNSTGVGLGALARTMPGVEIVVGGMNVTSAKFGGALKFMSSDPDLTTENPKFLAGIVARATEIYDGDTKGGMVMDLAVTNNAPGTTSVPVVVATVDFSGFNLVTGKVLRVNSQQVVGGRLAALPADATDLATAITLANAIKARMKATGGHGLVSD